MTSAMYNISSNNKTPKSDDWWQLTQGGSKVRHQSRLCWNATVNQTIVGGACLCDVTLTGIWDQLNLRKGKLFNKIKKNTGWICIIIGWLCTHTLPTHISGQTDCKSACSMTPLRNVHFYNGQKSYGKRPGLNNMWNKAEYAVFIIVDH